MKFQQIAGIVMITGLAAIVGCRGLGGEDRVAQDQGKLKMVQPDDQSVVERARQRAETGETPVAPVTSRTSVTTVVVQGERPVAVPPAPVTVTVAPASNNYVADFISANNATAQVPVYLHQSFAPGKEGFTVVLNNSCWFEVVFGRTLTAMDLDATIRRNRAQQSAFDMLTALNTARTEAGNAPYGVGDIDPRFFSRSPQSRGRRFSTLTLILSNGSGVQSVLFSPTHNEQATKKSDGTYPDTFGFPRTGSWLGNVTISGGNLVTFEDVMKNQVVAVNLERFAGRLMSDGRDLSFTIIDGNGNWLAIGERTLDPITDRLAQTLTFENGIDFSSGPLVVRPRVRGDGTFQLNILMRAVEAVPNQVALYASAPRGGEKSVRPSKPAPTPAPAPAPEKKSSKKKVPTKKPAGDKAAPSKKKVDERGRAQKTDKSS